MVVTRAPERLLLNGRCHSGCSVGPERVGEAAYALIHADIEAGESDKHTAERARDRGLEVTFGSVNRHRKNHLDSPTVPIHRADYENLTDLEALEKAIKQGQKNMDNWKMTPGEWMKALELKLRLTEGTVFDGFMRAVASASTEDADADAAGGSVRPLDVVPPSDAA